MADEEQKKIFSRNLNNYLSLNNKTQKEVADAIGVSPQTFNTWCQGIALPRMGKVQLLADYFNIGKTGITPKDERDITKDVDNIMAKLSAGEDGPASYNGEALDPEAADLFRDELQIALRRLKIINKEKYTPKKYKK